MRRIATVALVTLLAAAAPGRAAAQSSALLLPARGAGADATALDSARSSLRRRLEERGLTVREVESSPGTDLGLAELGALARGEGTNLVVDPELQDFAGMTSIRIRVVTSQGVLAGEASDLASAATLPQDAGRVLARALATASVAAPAPAAAPEAGVASPWDTEPTSPPPTVTPAGGEEPRHTRRRRRRRRPPEPEFRQRSVWLGGLIEPAMGTNRSAFSLMVGPRFEYQWRGLVAGLNLDYTYVVDWEPRSQPEYHSLAVFPVLGYLVNLGSPRFNLPIIASGGYIPGNGGLLRFEAGLAYKPTDQVDLRFIFVCPNFWFLEDTTVLFVSFSLQVLAGI